VYNYGKLSRDFTYIDDIVDGILQLIHIIPTNTVPYALYNIGRGEPISLDKFIQEIEKATKTLAIRNDLPMQAGDVEQTWASTKALKNVISYTPKVSLSEGVNNFVNWYQWSMVNEQ
jgi:UDP-glucuronate 4-epimerase